MPDSKRNETILFLVTGGRGAGKTSFCNHLAAAAREAGWKVAGIISQPVFEGSTRTAIEAENLSTGEKRSLAARSDHPTTGSKHWKFDEAVMDWGNQILQASTPCDLLIVDELGPLEFDRGEGWQAGLAAVDGKQYAIGVVVVRAEMLGDVLLRWPDVNLIEIETPEDSAHKAKVLAGQLF